MRPPDENLIAAALEALQSATTHEDIAHGAAQLTAGMGMERYVIAEVRAGQIAGIHHNGPAELDDPKTTGGDPIALRARESRMIPFAWRAAEGTWRYRNGDQGYLAGIAGAFFDPVGSGCIVIVSGSGPSIAPEHGLTLLAYIVAAAGQISAALSLIARPASSCPFTARELDCLLYTLAGWSAKESARALGISARTVEQYLERARAKLQAQSSYAAATAALRLGWLDLQKALELADLDAGARKVSIGRL